jgi:hypothetical protein
MALSDPLGGGVLGTVLGKKPATVAASVAAGLTVPTVVANGADFTDTGINIRSTSTYNTGDKYSLSLHEGSQELALLAFNIGSDGHQQGHIVSFDSGGVPSFGTIGEFHGVNRPNNIYGAFLSATLCACGSIPASGSFKQQGGTISGTVVSLNDQSAVASFSSGQTSGGSVVKLSSTHALIAHPSASGIGAVGFDASDPTTATTIVNNVALDNWCVAVCDTANNRGVVWGRDAGTTSQCAVVGVTVSGLIVTFGTAQSVPSAVGDSTIGNRGATNQMAVYLGSNRYMMALNGNIMICTWDGTTLSDVTDIGLVSYCEGGGIIVLDASDLTNCKLARFGHNISPATGVCLQGITINATAGSPAVVLGVPVSVDGTSGTSQSVTAAAVPGATTGQRVCVFWADADGTDVDLHYRLADITY